MKGFFTLLLVLWIMVAPQTLAQQSSSNQRSAQQHSAQQHKAKQTKGNVVKSSKHAAQMVKGRFGGKVLSSSKSGKSGYKVKLLKDDGHIISVFVNAKTGKIKG